MHDLSYRSKKEDIFANMLQLTFLDFTNLSPTYVTSTRHNQKITPHDVHETKAFMIAESSCEH